MGFGNMNNSNNATRAPGAPSRSKYAGVNCADVRDPMLGFGEYRVKIVGAVEGHNPGKNRDSYKVSLHVVAASDGAETRTGEQCTAIFFMTTAGHRELKSLALAAAGFGVPLGEPITRDQRLAAQEAYDALDAQVYAGSILEATAGHANGAPSLVGRYVDVVVTRGKPVDDGSDDYYRQYAWFIVPEEEQETQG